MMGELEELLISRTAKKTASQGEKGTASDSPKKRSDRSLYTALFL